MSQRNAWAIQETLKQQRQITLPWVQYTFQVPYSAAVWMMEQLELRGWIEPAGDGRNWRVNPQALFLRRLKKTECAALLEHLTMDCVSALDCLRKAQGKPVTAQMIEAAVRGHSDTEEALRVLAELNLIYFRKEYGFATISTAESRSLCLTARACFRRRIRERYAEEEAVEYFRNLLWDNIAKCADTHLCDENDVDDVEDGDDE